MFSFFGKRGAKSTRHPEPILTQSLTFMNREVLVKRKPYRRSIGLTLQASGRIRVSAPSTIPLSRIEKFLFEHAEWIDTQLKKFQSLRAAYPKKEYRAGENFWFMGRQVELQFVCGSTIKTLVQTDGSKLVIEIPPVLWSRFDPSASHPELAKEVGEFYAKQGKQKLAERVEYFSERMNLRPATVSYRSQKTRWGSCSSRGKISLNWRLIFAPLEVIDYVVVHELAHLKHYDHSPQFWSLVETQCSEYRRLRRWLKDHQYEADFLAKISELHG